MKRLPESTERMIESLIAAGDHDLQISKHLNVSRMTVRAIRLGKRKPRPAAGVVVPRKRYRVRTDRHNAKGVYVKCPTCGGKVIMPCELCRVRQEKAAAGKITGADFRPETSG